VIEREREREREERERERERERDPLRTPLSGEIEPFPLRSSWANLAPTNLRTR